MVGWVLMNTQDEQLGRELAEEALTYLEETLPQYIEHADLYSGEVCHAALGDMEATLDSLQERVAHNHIDVLVGTPYFTSHAPDTGSPAVH